MTNDEALARLTEIFRDVFEDETIVLTPDTAADDIHQWDSISQITLVVEIEHRFNIKLKSSQMEEVRGVRQLADLLRSLSSTSVP